MKVYWMAYIFDSFGKSWGPFLISALQFFKEYSKIYTVHYSLNTQIEIKILNSILYVITNLCN